jgi:hypothetical protein
LHKSFSVKALVIRKNISHIEIIVICLAKVIYSKSIGYYRKNISNNDVIWLPNIFSGQFLVAFSNTFASITQLVIRKNIIQMDRPNTLCAAYTASFKEKWKSNWRNFLVDQKSLFSKVNESWTTNANIFLK